MKTRHRIPTIFNLSMVDLLCCALGCVILLWLLFFREAKERAAEAQERTVVAGQVAEKLLQVEKALAASLMQKDTLQSALAQTEDRERNLKGDLKKVESERDKNQTLASQRQKDLNTSNADLTRLLAVLEKIEKENLSLLADKKLLAGAVDQKTKDLIASNAKLADALKQEDLLKQEVKAKQSLALATEKEIKALIDQMAKADVLVKNLNDERAALEKERAALKAKGETATGQAAMLEKELNRGKQALLLADKKNDELQQYAKKLEAILAATDTELVKAAEKAKDLEGSWQAMASRLRTAENRFAGIELKGERVLFLVDCSGSMGKKNYEVNDPSKWPTVCETVGKLMASLPNLKKFQVLLFSDDMSYPLGNGRAWFEYNGADSVKTTVNALKAKTPEGGTNMGDVLKEAFTGFKDKGVDTIYVFSDGLPNAGPGLPAKADNLQENERTALCCTWLRKSLKGWNESVGKQPRVCINTIGFYFDSPEVGAFLWVLAREHEGSFVGMSRP